MSGSGDSRPLVLFAVKEEAKYFRCGDVESVVGGMGQENASRVIQEILSLRQPKFVITSGFAGGLNETFRNGAVIGDWDEAMPIIPSIERSDIKRVRFHCAKHVAITADEKTELRRTTDCDAVEMESGVIRKICSEHGVPSATIRVISDAAYEDLPLNFNELMNPDYTMNFGKLIGVLIKNPMKIPKLIAFSGKVKNAARELGRVLSEVVANERSTIGP